ncbi:uncharacterized protein B0H18DRAFT_351863 [Fomitopsis serialis]|uniref:uncharacterized protein n=1 Tax=Fomitopsis serialis TaxID=139415 RepID=UPI002007F47A|nr:uncharacterized protein B0H18DRAFT_351863 [Neoantrodia serialis]KAH9926139.1 hypothetical protein B0H18DRAFT_351863 [Neoantrodia serialis]
MPCVLPAELTDHIIDFHWDEPPTLRSCALTCRTWRSASEYHLRAYHSLNIKSVTNLTMLSKRFARPESRRFYRDFEEMNIIESVGRPFIHILPLCIPGSFVPRLKSLTIWSLRRQGLPIGNQWHRSFFTLLSAYKSVAFLNLSNSQFHDVEELLRILEALPALEAILFKDVDIPHPSPSLVTRPDSGRRSQRRRRLSRLTLHFSHSTPDCLPALSCCGQLFSEITELTVDAAIAMAPLYEEHMYMARVPILQLTVVYIALPSIDPKLADQWYRGLQLDVEEKHDWNHRCLLPQDVSGTSADGAATRLTHIMRLEEVDYLIHAGKDYKNLSLTVQTIVAMLSRGVGQHVSKLCVSLVFIHDDSLPYPDGSSSVFPYPLSREAALVLSALQHVREISLDIEDPLTPVTSAAARIIPLLFPHWAASGRLSVKYPTSEGRLAGWSAARNHRLPTSD